MFFFVYTKKPIYVVSWVCGGECRVRKSQRFGTFCGRGALITAFSYINTHHSPLTLCHFTHSLLYMYIRMLTHIHIYTYIFL